MFDPQNSNIINDNKILDLNQLNFINELNKKNNVLTHNKDLKYYGVVFNTDNSSGSGTHWFSIFIDFTATPITIEYFNSSGYDIRNRKFQNYILNLSDELTIAGFDCKFVKVTDIQHQRDDTSNCGSYSLYYIWKRF